MLTSMTLQNFKSFGRSVTTPLEPITALVGPNNSGKSSFMSAVRFVKNVLLGGLHAAIQVEDGLDFLVHRPRYRSDAQTPPGRLVIDWSTGGGKYAGNFIPNDHFNTAEESITYSNGTLAWLRAGNTYNTGNFGPISTGPFDAMRIVYESNKRDPVLAPIANSTFIKLSLDSLRRDAQVVPSPSLSMEGDGLAAVLAVWRGSDPERAASLDQFMSECIPEIRNVFVKPGPVPGTQRVWFVQTDGQQFDAKHASDGVLAFTALAMHIIAAEKNSVFLIEEPEQSIHPRRLRSLVDLMRKAVTSRGCQFIVATHSPVLLNELRNTPERIMLFRRGPEGTEVTRCTEIPAVLEALETSSPGELLETAFFEGLAE